MDESKFKTDYQFYKKKVETKIQSHLNSDFFNGVPSRLKESMGYSLLAGGKRLRPVLMLLVNELVKSFNDESKLELQDHHNDILDIALVIEMIHTYSLIHDDLPAMDNDDLRRGKPTNHIQFGEATAILAGDALLNQSFEILAQLRNSSAVARVMTVLATAAGAKGMIGGQMIDMEATGGTFTLDELRHLHSLKTGKLILASVLLPVEYYQADSFHAALKSYGEKIGLAFQVMDDVLDMTQSSETLGKNSQSDLANDKSTYVKLMGIDEATDYADNLIKQAVELIEKIELENKSNQKQIDAKANLISIAKYIVNRNK